MVNYLRFNYFNMLALILLLCFSLVILVDSDQVKKSCQTNNKIIDKETIKDELYPQNYRRIIGGDFAEPGQFPYIVSFREKESEIHFCGGTIISEKIILTASHCIVIFYPDFHLKVIAILGAYTISDPGQLHYIENYAIHPNYNNEYLNNDIALVKLKETIIFNQYIQKIEYAKNDNLVIGTSGIVSGWGYTRFDGEKSKILKFLIQDIVSKRHCKRWFGPLKITPTVFCTFSLNGEGGCNGDSGGPFVIDDVLVGIVSFGTYCARGYPDVYTKVAAYAPWIGMLIQDL